MPKLSLLCVDTRLDAVERIFQHAVTLGQRHSRELGFNALMRRNQFEILCVVPTLTKAQSIEAYRRRSKETPLPFAVTWLPILLELVAPLNLN